MVQGLSAERAEGENQEEEGVLSCPPAPLTWSVFPWPRWQGTRTVLPGCLEWARVNLL